MEDIQFADGFDGPDPVAFGLLPAQLLAVVIGLLLTYLVAQSTLPLYLSAPAGLGILAVTAALGWLRLDGQPLPAWLLRAGRYLLRRHSGTHLFAPGATAGRDGPPSAPASGTPYERTPLGTGSPVGRADNVSSAHDRRLHPAVTEAHLEVRAARVVAFFSLTGGSGRTTMATELACLLAARGRWAPPGTGPSEPLRVALLDLDAAGAAVATRLGLQPPSAWGYATGGEGAGATAIDRLVRHESGALVLPGSPRPLSLRSQLAERKRLDLLRQDLLQGGAHITLIDVGTDLGPLALWGLEAADQVCIVLCPTAAGIEDGYRSTEVLRRLGHRDKLSYIANRCAGPGPLGDVMADLGGTLAAEIPTSSEFDSADPRRRHLWVDGAGPAQRAVERLAAHLCPPQGGPQ